MPLMRHLALKWSFVISSKYQMKVVGDCMEIVKSVSLFALAGLAEIGGGYLIWLWLREGYDAPLCQDRFWGKLR